MSDVFQAVIDGAKAGWCESIGNKNQAYELFKNIPIPGFDAAAGAFSPLFELSKGIEAAVCNRPPTVPPIETTGCDNVSGATHKLTVQLGENFSGCVTGTYELYCNGPVTLTVQPPGNDPCGWGFYTQSGSGSIIAFKRNGGALQNRNPIDGQTKGPQGGTAVKCGDVTPPAPGSNASTSTQPINGTNTPISYVFGPAYRDSNGQIQSPFSASFDLGGVNITLNGNLNLSTGNVFVGNPSPNGQNDPGSFASDGAPSDPTNTNDSGDETSDKGVIRGALVTITAGAARVGSVDNSPVPDLFIPRLGRISFLVRVADSGELGWTPPEDIKLEREFFTCLAPQGAIDVQAHFVGGVSGTVTPIRIKPEPTIVEN
jgi:hypothetical protein